LLAHVGLNPTRVCLAKYEHKFRNNIITTLIVNRHDGIVSTAVHSQTDGY